MLNYSFNYEALMVNSLTNVCRPVTSTLVLPRFIFRISRATQRSARQSWIARDDGRAPSSLQAAGRGWPAPQRARLPRRALCQPPRHGRRRRHRRPIPRRPQRRGPHLHQPVRATRPVPEGGHEARRLVQHQGAHAHGSRLDRERDEGVGPARTRRCRFPLRSQVVLHAQGAYTRAPPPRGIIEPKKPYPRSDKQSQIRPSRPNLPVPTSTHSRSLTQRRVTQLLSQTNRSATAVPRTWSSTPTSPNQARAKIARS